MDWSLVLVSQGIDTTIRREEGGRWGLVVASKDSGRAFKALRLYQAENRNWPWNQHLPWPETRFDWACLGWAAFLITLHWLCGGDSHLQGSGIMDTARVLSGQWWRVFTAITLHADLGHLAANLSIGIVLLGLAMGRYGTGTGLLAAFLAGAGGNLVSLLVNERPFQGLGASGMVMGALGLLAAQALLPEARQRQSLKFVLASVMAGVMLFVLFGLSPGTDMIAHLGGFVSGLALGTVLVHAPAGFARNFTVNLSSGIMLVALVVGTWWLAVTHG
jgi:membrane associated rhomboid family serine protease